MTLRRLGGLLALVALAAGGPLAAADQPPRDLHFVVDHWTAWDPPSTFPEGAEVYRIVAGDTLWDLARRFLGDPYLWPQLWERNQYIRDAHWIYPGDPLVVSVQVVPAEEVGAAPMVEPEPAAPAVEPAAPESGLAGVLPAGATAAPQPFGTEDDIYCSGFVGGLDEEFALRITGSEYQALSPVLPGRERGVEGVYGTIDTVKYGLAVGDVVYLDGGAAAGLVPGAVFTVVDPGPEIIHPLDRDTFGRLYRYLGRVRVLAVQESTAIGEIVQSCDPILVGAALRPFEPEPVPLGRRTPPRPINDPPPALDLAEAPAILFAEDGLVSLGQDHVVFIDHGTEEAVTPGDVYTIYRMNREGFPPLAIGEVAVLTVHSHSAVAKIIDSRATVYVGDRLLRK
jgi:hypothetical protein